MLEAFSFDWQMATANLLRMLLAFALDSRWLGKRVKSERSLGLRTFRACSAGWASSAVARF